MAALCCLTSALLACCSHMGLGLCQTVVQLGVPHFSRLPEPLLVIMSTMGWARPAAHLERIGLWAHSFQHH